MVFHARALRVVVIAGAFYMAGCEAMILGVATYEGHTDAARIEARSRERAAMIEAGYLSITGDGQYRPGPGYTWVNPDDPDDPRVVSIHLIRDSDGSWRPAPGYKWVNPNDPKDLRVVRR